MDTILQRIQAMLSEMVTLATDRVSDLLPEVLFAILVVFIGWLSAVILHFVCSFVLSFFAIDKLAAKTPLEGMLKSVGIRRSISEILSLLVFWLAILFTLVVAADLLHLPQVSSALAIITRYIPQVIAALLIIIFGMLLAKFLQMLATQALLKMDITYGRSVGKGVQVVVLTFVFLAATEQLGFDLNFITTSLVMIISTLLLMLGLGTAIGARTVLDNLVACQQLKRQVKVGDSIELDGITGTIENFTLTSVELKTGGSVTVLPATHFFTHTYTHTSSS